MPDLWVKKKCIESFMKRYSMWDELHKKEVNFFLENGGTEPYSIDRLAVELAKKDTGGHRAYNMIMNLYTHMTRFGLSLIVSTFEESVKGLELDINKQQELLQRIKSKRTPVTIYKAVEEFAEEYIGYNILVKSCRIRMKYNCNELAVTLTRHSQEIKKMELI